MGSCLGWLDVRLGVGAVRFGVVAPEGPRGYKLYEVLLLEGLWSWGFFKKGNHVG